MGQANVFKDVHAKEIIVAGILTALAQGTSVIPIQVKNTSGNIIASMANVSSLGELRAANSSGTTQVDLKGGTGSWILNDLVIGQNTAADTSAMLEIESTTKGVLFPRMTEAQRDAISSPTAGLVIYNSTTNKLNVRVAAAWEAITSA